MSSHLLTKHQVLDFAVSDDRQTLDLNGSPLFPLRSQVGPLTAFQTLREPVDDDESIHGSDRRLDYTAGARTIEAADGTDAQLIDLFLSITGLEDEPITVDGIDIRMLPENELLATRGW